MFEVIVNEEMYMSRQYYVAFLYLCLLLRGTSGMIFSYLFGFLFCFPYIYKIVHFTVSNFLIIGFLNNYLIM